ncbi:E4 protein [Human papillomavirus 174]|uniref:E4 protein n=1 Tax=Human papillomavirus 174 TaxID=1347832 RepID=M5ETD0_9PAPI|nr:E4 protein [Human papillomavirus 174]
MLQNMASKDIGKCMLIRTLCLLLSLALRKQLETGNNTIPLTPFPGPNPHPPPVSNGRGNRPDTDEKHPALQPPPEGKRRSSDKKRTNDQQGPDQVPVTGKKPGGTQQDGNGGEEETPPPETAPPPAPPVGEGEGEVEGGPPQDPGRAPAHTPGGLLPELASRLQQWEGLFNQLVDSITEDLTDYWQKLATPQ